MTATTTVDWDRARSALQAETNRVTALLRSVRDQRATALGGRSIAEVAAHLSHAWTALLGMTGPGAGSLIGELGELSEVTSRAVRSDAERDPAVLADRIDRLAEEFLGQCRRRLPDEVHPWLVAGVTVDLRTTTCHLLNETVVHGYDIAVADRRGWRVDRPSAAMVLAGFLLPMVRALDPGALLHPVRAAGFRAAYDLRIRGVHRYRVLVDDGALRLAEPGPRRVDCNVSADPAALLLVLFGRRDPRMAVVTGRLAAWGRRPWLGMRLASMLRTP